MAEARYNVPPENVADIKDYVDVRYADLFGQLERRVEVENKLCSAGDDRLWEAIGGLRTAISVASAEREKAAEQLRVELLRSTTEGDERLREHIEQQYKQIEAALVSAELLEVERLAHVSEKVESVTARVTAHLAGMQDRAESVEAQLKTVHDSLLGEMETLSKKQDEGDSRLHAEIYKLAAHRKEATDLSEGHSHERLEAVRRELSLIQSAAKEAVLKAETANERRFDGVNEFRASLADQASQFIPREVAETQFNDLRKQIQANTDQINLSRGSGEGLDKAVLNSRTQLTMILVGAGVVVAVVLGVIGLFVGQ